MVGPNLAQNQKVIEEKMERKGFEPTYLRSAVT